MNDKKSMLLVDDQKNIRLDLKCWLERSNYFVYPAASYEEAECIIKSCKLHFAIIDLKLDYKSDYGGIEIVHIVKKYRPYAKIIILSAYSFSNDIQSQVEGKYDAFVSKGGPDNYIAAVRKKLKELDLSYQSQPVTKKRKEENEDTQGIYQLHMLQGHKDPITRIRWSPDGRKLASASTDNSIRIWDAETGQCIKTITGHDNWIWCVSWSPNGLMLASASEDATVRIWDQRQVKL